MALNMRVFLFFLLQNLKKLKKKSFILTRFGPKIEEKIDHTKTGQSVGFFINTEIRH